MTVNKTLHTRDHGGIDPRQTILEKIGDLSDFKLTGMQVLMATYQRPKKEKSGLLSSDEDLKEDEYQGKVGLILKMGPLAFARKDVLMACGADEAGQGGDIPEVGDFAFYRIHDGFSVQIHGQPCRIFEDKQIRGVIGNPDMVL